MLKQKFVKLIYADHNRSAIVRKHLSRVINSLGSGGEGLCVGSGNNPKLHPDILNLDINPGENVDIVASADAIPAPDNRFSIVVSQECLEHVSNPFAAIKEIYRVLKKDGLLYLQLPFIIGYHPGPHDYWRFTREGIEELVKSAGFSSLEIQQSVGNATGYYRISVEFWALLFSTPAPALYRFFKAVFAALLYPIKYLDGIFACSPEKDRIPGGYLIVAKK